MITIIAGLSILLLVLSWPRFLGAFRYVPVDRALERYFASNEIPGNRLPELIRFAEASIARHDQYRYRDGLSLLYYLRALDPRTPAHERRDAYRRAESEAVESLRQAPAQSDIWLRLATIRWVLHDEPETIVEPWKMSVFTGRAHSTLFVRRVEIGLAYRSWLDDEGLAMLRDQLRLAWTVRPGPLAGALARQDRELAAVRDILQGSDADMLADLEAWLEKLR
jgi:hypothetical protein